MKRKKGYTVSPAHQSQKRLLGETGVYMMAALLYPHKCKWGISDRTDLRRAQVDKDVAGAVYTVFGREIPFGWTCEQIVHWLYQKQNAPMRKGTGRSEWYYVFNPIFGTAAVLSSWYFGVWFGWPVYAFAYFLPWVWLDGLLWLLLFRFAAWGLAAAMIWGLDLIWQIGIFEALKEAAVWLLKLWGDANAG